MSQKSLFFIFILSCLNAYALTPFNADGYLGHTLQTILDAISVQEIVPSQEKSGFFNAQDTVPERWKGIWSLIQSMSWTTYYALGDTNRMDGNISSWKFDTTSLLNVPFRASYYALLSHIENWARDHKEALGPEYAKYVYLLSLLRTTGPMLSLNSRYEDIRPKYHIKKEWIYNATGGVSNEAASTMAAISVAWDHFGWFYLFARRTVFINEWFYALVPRPGKFASTMTQNRLMQGAVFSATYFLLDYVLYCIKNTFFQLLSPNPTDCTICYFGTNAMGPTGPIGRHIFDARKAAVDAVVNFAKEPISADPQGAAEEGF
jgi:hypothetical protein